MSLQRNMDDHINHLIRTISQSTSYVTSLSTWTLIKEEIIAEEQTSRATIDNVRDLQNDSEDNRNESNSADFCSSIAQQPR